ncbi:hypothetical protein [Bacteriovorax sp. Seq25_V]|uniref:hypothetical protein n=1 Tax=Bacteriovorax sp. Seq25_V TaxID=1201288 RepID=UPI00038A1E87|nr:hypothetical protein [Bacteriovorax sp. Seq25_V]EQC45682.1 hypothetical protein M900_2063 [Bacteriovorax sp. Seq25_V]
MFKRLNLSHFDATIMLIGVSLITVGSYYYQTDFNNTLTSASGKIVGRLIEGKGNQKRVGNLFWLPLQNESKIWNGDKIFANQDQQINIELLKSKAIVNVPKESLVVITENQDDIVLNLDRGEISIASGEKDIQFKIQSNTGVSKSIKVAKKSVVNLKRVDSNTLLDVKQGKADLVLNTQEKDNITVQANDIVKVSSSNLEKIRMNNILKAKSIDPLIDNDLSLVSDKFDGQTVEIYQSLGDRPIATKVVKSDKIEMDDIGPGNYFVKVANSQILDRVQVKEYKPIQIDLKESSQQLLQGEKIDFKWSNPNSHTVEVTINSPSGDLFRKITTGNQLAFYPQESGAHNISVVPVKKVGAKHEPIISESLKLTEGPKLFVADSVLSNIVTKLDKKSDVKRSSGHNVMMLTTSDGVSLQKEFLK